MRINFKHKDVVYHATGKLEVDDIQLDTIEYQGENILPVIISLNLVDEFIESIREYLI